MDSFGSLQDRVGNLENQFLTLTRGNSNEVDIQRNGCDQESQRIGSRQSSSQRLNRSFGNAPNNRMRLFGPVKSTILGPRPNPNLAETSSMKRQKLNQTMPEPTRLLISETDNLALPHNATNVEKLHLRDPQGPRLNQPAAHEPEQKNPAHVDPSKPFSNDQ